MIGNCNPRELLTKYLAWDTVDYSIHISPNLDFVFFENPKVACTSIKELFYRVFRPQLSVPTPSQLHDRAMLPTLRPSQVTDAKLLHVLSAPDVFRFAFVRDPLERLVSFYYGALQKDRFRTQFLARAGLRADASLSLDEFIILTCRSRLEDLDYHCLPQNLLLFRGHVDLHQIGRFETLATDLEAAVKVIAGRQPEMQIPHLNRGHSTCRDQPSHETAEAVFQCYKADYVEFGYQGL